MESLNNYITERIRIDNVQPYNYTPKNGKELQNLMIKLVKERGNDGDFNDIDTTGVENMTHLCPICFVVVPILTRIFPNGERKMFTI